MKVNSAIVILAAISAAAIIASANPIPVPPLASMPLEEIYVQIQPDGNSLHAVFTGDFTFVYIPKDVNLMLFPVPPDANNIRVRADSNELPWTWSSEEYPTILPEMPNLPMIEWQGPFHPNGAVFRVDYEHDLIERPNDFIFFYALGTGKYFPSYDKTTTAKFDFLLPDRYTVASVCLDETPHEYKVLGSHLVVPVESYFGPIVHDLIVSLVPINFERCGVLVQGVECVLFLADGGGLYELDNLGDFKVGSRVHVRGQLEPHCPSYCMQGDGCIRHNTICPCPQCDFNTDGDTDQRDFAVLAAAWASKPHDDNWNPACDVSVPADSVIDIRDVVIVACNWLKGEFGKPSLGESYVPYDNPIEPNATGYTLPLNLNEVTNYADMDSKFGLASFAPLLEQNGFAIIEYAFRDLNDIVGPYEQLRKMDVPLFVTADTLLHLYHVQFDETLKDIEEREFVSDINDLTAALLAEALEQYAQYTGDLQEAARRNTAYLAVAMKLIDTNVEVPAFVATMVNSELAKIDAHEGFAPSDIFIYLEDYSQYVPRGHYTRSEELKRYFRTLMWYGRMAFLLKGAENWCPWCEALISIHDAKIQTMQAVLLATSLDTIQVGPRTGRRIWDRIYTITSFYVGLADDLTPYEYLWAVNKVFGSDFVPTDLDDPNNFFSLKVELALLRSPQIYGGTGNIWVLLPITPDSLDEVLDKTKGMRFMGQRFIPDSYMFQHLVTPKVLDYTGDGNPIPFSYGTTPIGPQRCYPRGLDVMAILGSTHARTILVDQGDTDYVNYWPRFNELKVRFDAFDVSDWNRNLYWSWLYSLRALIDEFPAGYPNFMRTQAWQKKELNAALASWTELRHDTILYAKQSYTPVPTGPPPDPPPGYVEPVPEFYGRLLALTRMTREGLSELNALSAEATERLVNLEGILARLIEIANKELTNEILSEDDCRYIEWFGKTLETAVIGVEDTGVKTTLIADVHTYSYEKLVVEEAVGYVELIIAAFYVPNNSPPPPPPTSLATGSVNGSIFLAAGPVLSYYEFKHPMSDRLTDEAWRQLLDSPNRPDRPAWWFQQSPPP
jgi:hypothetical protein